jgi:cytochrome c
MVSGSSLVRQAKLQCEHCHISQAWLPSGASVIRFAVSFPQRMQFIS